MFLLLSGLRAEERPTFARHSQSPVAHLSTRHLLKGQGVPQLDHIQEKPGGEKQSLTNLLMCTCTCMWKGTFQEEVCLPFFIKKKSVFFICRLYTMWHMMFIFTPSFSLSLFPFQGNPLFYTVPHSLLLLSHPLVLFVFCVSIWNLLEYRGLYPWRKGLLLPSLLLIANSSSGKDRALESLLYLW